jgi:H+-transporting ATPase
VFPEHKFHIVDVLQKHDHIVGMTGDGVNDAPALKKADCGIAVSGATDAARAAAAIVLVTPGTVGDHRCDQGKPPNLPADEQLRDLPHRRDAARAAVHDAGDLVFNFYPLTAVMIVMLALLNDGAILSIAYDNVIYKDQPEAWNMRLVLGIATVLGVVGPSPRSGCFISATVSFISTARTSKR